MSSTRSALTTLTSVAAATMIIRTVIRTLIPQNLRDHMLSKTTALLTRLFSPNLTTITIKDRGGDSVNQIFPAVEAYLRTKVMGTSQRIKISKQEKETAFKITMDVGEELIDTIGGVRLRWLLTAPKSFELTFDEKHREMVIQSYLPSIANQSHDELNPTKIYIGNYYCVCPSCFYSRLAANYELWFPIELDHPATFDTVAMDPQLKVALMYDLDLFVQREEYHRRVGKAWKRGYFLHGPRGTGKSSLIAAMAKYLKFDIYDLELRGISHPADLRKLFSSTKKKSIIIVEDVDRIVLDMEDWGPRDIHEYRAKVTLSMLLRFMDGLWSCCGNERIIVITTAEEIQLIPELLRPGRMDMHIHMSYCSPCVLKSLVSVYHSVEDHPLLDEVGELISKVKVTPAEVAGELMKSDDLDIALRGLLEVLEEKCK